MASPTSPIDSRPHCLATELRRLGLPTESALAVAARLTRSHPLARRVGVLGIARWLRHAGLSPEVADEEAAVLFALDALDIGRSFNQVVRELGLAGVPPQRAHGAAYEAARIHRSAPLPEEDDLLPAPMMVGAIATTVALAMIALHVVLTH